MAGFQRKKRGKPEASTFLHFIRVPSLSTNICHRRRPHVIQDDTAAVAVCSCCFAVLVQLRCAALWPTAGTTATRGFRENVSHPAALPTFGGSAQVARLGHA